MKKITIKDLCTPKDEYIILSEASTLYEAIMQLNQQQKEMGELAHSTVLIKDQSGKIISHLNIFDVMRGIEPRYKQVENLSSAGISEDLVKQIYRDSQPWTNPLTDLCSNAPQIQIKDIMPGLSKTETISVNDELNMALHKIVVNQQHSLLVFDDEEFTGVLRSIDIFNLIRSEVEKCKLDQS